METVCFVADIAGKRGRSNSESGSGTSITSRSASSFIFDHAERDGSGDDTGVKITDEISAVEAARILSRMGVQHVIITLGSKGALICSDGKRDSSCFESRSCRHDCAGDVFNGA